MYLYVSFFILLFKGYQCKEINRTNQVQATLVQMTDSLMINFAVGNPLVTWFKQINQASDINWSGSQFYSSQMSTSSIKLATIDEGEIIEDSWVTQFEDANITYSSFKYIHIKDETKKYSKEKEGWIGLGYSFKDQSYSLTHILKQKKYIDYLSYSFIFKTKIGDGFIAIQEIIFGKIPHKYIHNDQVGNCKVIPSQSKWSCSMPQIIINDTSYDNHYETFFQVLNHEIYFPHEYMEIITEKIFKGYLENGQCDILTKKELRYFECTKGVMHHLPNITFQFDNYKYTFNLAELFRSNTLSMKSSFGEHSAYSDTWVIGSAFIMYFNSMFDYEKGQVFFYSKEARIENSTPLNTYSHVLEKNILSGICIIMIVGLCCMFLIKKELKI